MTVELLAPIFLSIGLALPLFLVRMGHSPVAPINLIWISQLVPFGVALLNFGGRMPMPHMITWIVLGSSFVAILSGWLVATIMTRTPAKAPVKQLSRARLFVAFLTLAALYFLSIAQGVAAQKGFPLLSSKPDIARSMFMIGRLQNIFFAAGIPMFLLGIHLYRISPERILRFLVAIALAGLVVTYLLIGSRFMMLVWLSMFIAYWDLYVKRLPLLKIASILLLFLLLFALIGYFRYGKLLAKASGSSKLIEVGILMAIESVYSYIANAYWNLDHALHLWYVGALRLPTWGLSTNEGILWILGLVPDLQNAYGFTNALNSDVMLRSGLNATSYHWGLFKDAQLLGPVLGSFAMGWILTYLYQSRCRTGDASSVMVYGLLTYFILGSFNLLPSVIPTPVFGMIFLVSSLYLASVPRENRSR